MSRSSVPVRAPWWATFADVLSLALAAGALWILASGGYRGRIAGVVVSLKSPIRLLVVAVVVGAARHLAVPRPNLLTRLHCAAQRLIEWIRRRFRAMQEILHADGVRPRELLGVSALMIVLTIVMLYPFVRHLDRVSDLGDPLFSIWRVAWVAHQLPIHPLHLYDANIFFPEQYALAYSDGMPLTGIAAAPFIWLGVPAATVCNLFVLFSFVLCGLTMYLLVRSLVGSALPALVSAVAFAFYPFRFEHFLHMELLSAFWMPLALWALHRTLTEPARRWPMALLAGVALAAQYLSGMYFGVFLASFMFIVWAVLALAERRRAVTTMKPVLAGAVLAGVLVLPTLPPYMHVRSAIGDRARDEVQTLSARPADYLAVHHPAPRRVGCNERQVFPGFLIVLLAVVALWPPLSPVRVAYILGLVFVFDASLGPNGIIQPLLYDWLLPFRGLRAPVRYAMLVGLSLSVLAGFGAARLVGFVRSPRWKAILVVVMCGVILAEPRPALETKPLPAVPPVYDWFRSHPATAIVELPVWYPIADHYLFYSTFHWSRLVNGSSGSIPHLYRPLHEAMRAFPDESAIRVLRAYGVSYAVIHEEFYGSAGYRDMIQRIEASPALGLVYTANDGRFEARIYAVAR